MAGTNFWTCSVEHVGRTVVRLCCVESLHIHRTMHGFISFLSSILFFQFGYNALHTYFLTYVYIFNQKYEKIIVFSILVSKIALENRILFNFPSSSPLHQPILKQIFHEIKPWRKKLQFYRKKGSWFLMESQQTKVKSQSRIF